MSSEIKKKRGNRHSVDEWIATRRKIFDRDIEEASGTKWGDKFWRLDALRRRKNLCDTKLDVNVEAISIYLRSPVESGSVSSRVIPFLEFTKALILEKAISRNWDVSQVTLDGIVTAMGFLVGATIEIPARHPGDLIGRHFDEAQRLLMEAIHRRDMYIEKNNLPTNAKVKRVDEFGNLCISERNAYKCTRVLVEVSKTLRALTGGQRIIFTPLITWDEKRFNGRGLSRKRDRDSLYPDIDAIYFLADLAQNPDKLLPMDRLYLRLIELILVADKRISEVLALPFDPVVERDGVLGLRYQPRKGAAPYVTWIPQEPAPTHQMRRLAVESDSTWTAARTMFLRAIKDIQAITERSRMFAKKLEAAMETGELSLPPPENNWPFIAVDYEVVGLIPGTEISEYYTKSEIESLGINMSARGRGLRGIRVKFKRRISSDDGVSYISREMYCRLSDGDRDREWKKFIELRASTRPEEYLSVNEFIRLFCEKCSSRERGRVRRWWLEYHRLLHGETFNIDPRSVVGMISKLSFQTFLVHQRDLRDFLLGEYRVQRIIQRDDDVSEVLPLSDALFCIDDGLWRPGKQNAPFVRPLTAASVRGWLIGNKTRVSVFSRYGRDDLVPIAPHMLRRFNTTELRLAGVSSIYIARQAGRSIRHVDDYDYIEDSMLIDIGRNNFGHDMMPEIQYVADLRSGLAGHSIPFQMIADFVKGQLSGRSATEFGSCSHEHSIGACPSFKACYMGCGEFWVKKGDLREMARHRADYLQTRRALEAARSQLGEAFYSAHYVVQYGAQLITLRRILDVHADRSIPDGTMYKPMPQKRVPSVESLRALFDDDESLREILEIVDQLLAAEDANGGKAA
ncbi:site-specific integrase [Burkholderia cenocepacia]|uniref:hypothetical protein n=1 Tax=Burkholderia cenocepacia TaxID=95486 RepID=UPI0009E1387D|nr:hypothetical protein [Burkholderia cenocepacia]ARF89620.1 uncharacterized protein BCN122_II2877 [Burkholderia cenocepacia]MCW3678283.1 hypothetical protein [Burkholderia cenocepacia]MDC6086094.1 hypothetical protein [Burkholderia cenocepacia]